MYFSEALELLRQGGQVTRQSWGNLQRGQDPTVLRTFIEMQRPDEHSKMNYPYLYIVTVTLNTDGNSVLEDRVPWTPSQMDILADDWITLKFTGEKEMRNFIHRIMVLPQSGYGNPNQYKLLPVFKKGNHDLFAINVDNEDENFVLFTRSKKEYDQFGGAMINSNDVLNIVDFIYDLASKVYDERDDVDIRYTFEIDFGNDIYSEIRAMNIFDFNVLEESVCTPGQKAFISMMTMDHGHLKQRPDFKFVFKSFNPDDCKLYFFKNCENYNTPKCCKHKCDRSYGREEN